MDFTVIGDIFVDIFVKGTPSEINFVHGGTCYSDLIHLNPGGSGTIALGLSRLGCKTTFIGKSGNDFSGKFYSNYLMNENINTNIIFDKLHPTGILITFLDPQLERSFLVSRGANDFLSPDEIESYTNTIISSKYLYICGYSLVNYPQREAILRAAEIAKKAGVLVVFDPGAYNLIDKNKSFFEKLIKLCDVFTPNLKEAQAITCFDNIEDILRQLAKKVPVLALKMGNNGCILVDSKKTVRLEGNPVNCLDSSGAGDAFVSALLFGLINDISIETTAQFANWYASYVIQKIGPWSFPTLEEIKGYLCNFKEFSSGFNSNIFG